METFSNEIDTLARQQLISHLLTQICILMFTIFAWLYLLNVNGVSMEIPLIPIALNSLQTFVYQYVQSQKPLLKQLEFRLKENRIIMLESIFLFTFCLSMEFSFRLPKHGFNMPYTASCFPLILILFVRYVLYKSIFKAFKNPYNFIKYVLQLFITNLVINYALKYDNYFRFDVIAFFWPCYGFIALSFIFFMGGVLIFIGSTCGNMGIQEDTIVTRRGQQQRIEEDSTFSFVISFWMLLNCTTLLTSSILVFLILLKQLNDQTVFKQGFIAIITSIVITILYSLFNFNRCFRWYCAKILRPSIISELKHIELAKQEQIIRTQTLTLQQESNEQRPAQSESLEQSSSNLSKQDLIDLNKIELLDEQPATFKQEVLGSVPRFIVKISNSYYQKVEQYAKNVLDRITKVEIDHARSRLTYQKNVIQPSEKKSKKSLQNFKKLGIRSNQQETEVDKLSVADEKINYKKASKQFVQENLVDDTLNDLEMQGESNKDVDDYQTQDHRICLTNNLLSIPNTESQFTQQAEGKQIQRRRSFDISLLKQFNNNEDKIYPKVMKEKLLKQLQIKKQNETNNNNYSLQTVKTNQGLFENQKQQQLQQNSKEYCMLCLDQKSNAVILECGHSSVCFLCAFKIYRKQRQCHLCRQQINKVIKVQRIQGLSYQKVLGVVQKIGNKFYYSDVTRENIINYKRIKDSQDIMNNNQRDSEPQFDTDMIDEGETKLDQQVYVLDPHESINFKSIDCSKKRCKSI